MDMDIAPRMTRIAPLIAPRMTRIAPRIAPHIALIMTHVAHRTIHTIIFHCIRNILHIIVISDIFNYSYSI
jgi:hypothetical protein